LSSRFSFVALVAALALTVAACGGGDIDTTDTTDDAAADTTEAAADTTTVAPDGETTTTVTDEVTETTEPASAVSSSTGPVVDGQTVAVHYTGTLDDGEQFDSSEGREPLTFTVGSGQVIAGFDDAVRGLSVGDSVTVRLEPADAYGEVDPELVIEFPIEEVPEEFQVEGIQVLLGGSTPATVIEVTEDTVTVDANHELAGQALTFEIELVEIVG
jgi:peptidylprolyl isomerase